MAAAAARKQDMPPPGGFKPLDYSRIPAKSLIGGKTLIAANFALTAFGLYLYTVHHRRVEREQIELRGSIYAITPLLQAEKDREYLKQCRKNRDAEAKLMENVEGWEVGKYEGEPIYKTITDDTFVKPSLREYFLHTAPEWLQTFRHMRYWD